MVDEYLQLDLVFDPEHLPQLLHHLLPVLVRAEGGPRSAEGGLGQVRLREAPGLQQLEFLERRKKNIVAPCCGCCIVHAFVSYRNSIREMLTFCKQIVRIVIISVRDSRKHSNEL